AEHLLARGKIHAAIGDGRRSVDLDVGHAVRGREELLVQHRALVAGAEDEEPGKDVADIDLAVGEDRRAATVATVAQRSLPEWGALLRIEAVEPSDVVRGIHPAVFAVQDRRGVADLDAVVFPYPLPLAVFHLPRA